MTVMEARRYLTHALAAETELEAGAAAFKLLAAMGNYNALDEAAFLEQKPAAISKLCKTAMKFGPMAERELDESNCLNLAETHREARAGEFDSGTDYNGMYLMELLLDLTSVSSWLFAYVHEHQRKTRNPQMTEAAVWKPICSALALAEKGEGLMHTLHERQKETDSWNFLVDVTADNIAFWARLLADRYQLTPAQRTRVEDRGAFFYTAAQHRRLPSWYDLFAIDLRKARSRNKPPTWWNPCKPNPNRPAW